jgi:hypothetical protein
MTVGFVARSATRLWLSYLAGAAALSALSWLIR